MYFEGKGTIKNINKALESYKKSADLGYHKGQYKFANEVCDQSNQV